MWLQRLVGIARTDHFADWYRHLSEHLTTASWSEARRLTMSCWVKTMVQVGMAQSGPVQTPLDAPGWQDWDNLKNKGSG